MTRTKIYIDIDKLYAQFKRIGFTANRIAYGLGYNNALFSNAKARGYMSDEVADRLERVYGIKRSTYEIAEPKPAAEPTVEKVEEPKPEEPKTGIDYVQLYNTIYAATLAALQANAKGLHEHLFEVK